jgi:hypothetical protein
MLRVDRRAPWRTVQLAMQACADPAVRIRLLQFACRGESGGAEAVPVPLPADRELGRVVERHAGAHSVVSLALEESRVEIAWCGRPVGHGEKALAALDEEIAGVRESGREVRVRLDAEPRVPHGDVVRVLDALMAAGVTEILFRGTPPPRDRSPAEIDLRLVLGDPYGNGSTAKAPCLELPGSASADEPPPGRPLRLAVALPLLEERVREIRRDGRSVRVRVRVGPEVAWSTVQEIRRWLEGRDVAVEIRSDEE